MANIPLTPIIPDSERDIPGFSVCDIEATGWVNFLLIGLAYKKYDENDKCIGKHYEEFQDISEFCSACFEDDQPNNIFFAHFGGKYDFSFLINELFDDTEKYFIHGMIPRGSGLLCMSVSTFTREKETKDGDQVLTTTHDGHFLVAKRTISFKDSSAMLPFGLKSLTEDFNVEHKKLDIDHTEVTKVTPELSKYAEWDHWGLYEVLEHYFRWPIIRQAGAKYTMASQALQVLRTFIKHPIPSLSGDADSFIRQSYFGGRTEIFKPFYEQNSETSMLRSFDVNSLYPFVMRELEFPTRFRFETNQYMENRMGFYDVEVVVPDMYIPPLGLKYEGMQERLIFPTGKFRSVWSTLELNYAISIGCKITKVHRGMVFDSGGKIFEDYVNALYSIRQKAPKASVDNVLCKLLMNSCYGRFALNLEREKLVFDHGQAGIIPHWDIPSKKDDGRIIRLATEATSLDTSFANAAVAAWVTSGSRVHMHKLYNQAPKDLYYTDTDSMKSTHKYAKNDDDLGQLKLEYMTKRAVFLLPKTYLEDTNSPIFNMYDSKGRLRTDSKTAKKQVMKGFDRKTSDFTFEDFTIALEGDMKRLAATNPRKFATLRTAVSHGTFLKLLEESPRQIRSRYTKRRVFKGGSQVYDTEPLHIKNGDIVNLDKEVLKKWKKPAYQDMEHIAHQVVHGLGASMEE
ncbi:MAG: DNA polymerase [Pseudomonadota bacterium]